MNVKLIATFMLGVGLAFAAGCGGKQPEHKHDGEGESHEHGEGPHGGIIFDLGKYHAEFKPDHGKKEATVWMLGLDEKSPARVKADKLRLVISNTNPKIEIDLLPTDAAPDGTASTFTGKHEGLGQEMEYQGTVTMTVDGKPHSGDFKEEGHKD